VFIRKNSNVSVNLSFFLAGASTLIFQLAWMRAIQRYVGIALPTVALITAIFMIGLLVGGLVARRFADGARQPLKLYSLGQTILAVAGLIYFLFHSQLYALIERIATPNSALLYATELFRIALISAALLVPTICMGAAFPLIAKALSEYGAKQDQFVYAYGANLIGGCSGALLCGFLLLPHYGIAVSSCVGAVLSLGAALLVISQWHRSDESVPKQEKLPPLERGKMIVPAVLSGFAIFLLELLWTRFLFLVVGGTTYSFALTLAWQLIALALASALVADKLPMPQWRFWLPKMKLLPDRAEEVIISGAGLAGVSILVGCYAFHYAPIILLELEGFWLLVFTDYFGAFFSSRVLLTGLFVFPPAFFLGLIFPVVLSRLDPERANYSSQVATLYIVNTIGAVAACAFGGVFLVPVLSKLGPHPFLFAFEILAVMLLTFSVLKEHRMTAKSYLLIAAVVLILILPPIWPAVGAAYLPATKESLNYLRDTLNTNQAEKLLFYNEGVNSTVSVVQHEANNILALKCDGKIEAALPNDRSLPAPTSDSATHIMLGYIPTLISPRAPQDVFVIGLGSGLTADAILDSPQVRNLTVADLEKSTLDASSFFTSNFQNKEAFKNGRAQFVACDGRNYLSLLTHQYDVIVSQPDEPYVNGMSDLYTAEFWQLAKSRLRQGGVFAQWIQLYAIDEKSLTRMLSTFISVFPKSQVFMSKGAAEIIVVGFNLPLVAEPARLEQFDNARNLMVDQYKFELPHYPDLCIDYNRVVTLFKQPQYLTRFAQLGIAEPEDFLAQLKMGKGDFSAFESGENKITEIYSDDKILPESALSTQRLLSAKPLTEKLCNFFARMPSKINGTFTNVGEVKRDVSDLYHEMNWRYQNLFRANKGALNGDNFSDARLLATIAQRFNSTAIGIVMPSITFYNFNQPLPRALKDQMPGSPLGLSNSEDLRFYGIRYDQVSNQEQAKNSFEGAVKFSPRNIHRRDLGEFYLNRDSAEKSIPIFEEAIKTEPTAFWAWEGAGLAFSIKKDAARAEQFLRKSLLLCPSLYKARLQLGKLLCAQGRAEEGLKDIYWASVLKPEEFEPNLYVTAFYAAKLNWYKAEENLPLLLKKLPGDPRVTYLSTQISHRRPIDLKFVGIKEDLAP
jgi:spermidine synthase/tetratricopeptide (TPR) repeat protein